MQPFIYLPFFRAKTHHHEKNYYNTCNFFDMFIGYRKK